MRKVQIGIMSFLLFLGVIGVIGCTPRAFGEKHYPKTAVAESESNDSYSSADDLGTLSSTITITGSTDSDDDDDWFEFEITSTTKEIHVDFEFSSSYTSVDLYIYYSPTGSYLDSDTYSSDGEFALTHKPTVTGTYYIKVEQDSTIVRSYTGTVHFGSDTGAPSGDAGDDYSSATLVTSGSSISGYLSQADDEDWFQFTVTSGQVITASVTEGPGLDVDVFLRNPDRDSEDSDTYDGGTVTHTATVSGTWYVEIEWDSSGDIFGTYTCQITVTGGGGAGNLLTDLWWLWVIIGVGIVAGVAGYIIQQQQTGRDTSALERDYDMGLEAAIVESFGTISEEGTRDIEDIADSFLNGW